MGWGRGWQGQRGRNQELGTFQALCSLGTSRCLGGSESSPAAIFMAPFLSLVFLVLPANAISFCEAEHLVLISPRDTWSGVWWWAPGTRCVAESWSGAGSLAWVQARSFPRCENLSKLLNSSVHPFSRLEAGCRGCLLHRVIGGIKY